MAYVLFEEPNEVVRYREHWVAEVAKLLDYGHFPIFTPYDCMYGSAIMLIAGGPDGCWVRISSYLDMRPAMVWVTTMAKDDDCSYTHCENTMDALEDINKAFDKARWMRRRHAFNKYKNLNFN